MLSLAKCRELLGRDIPESDAELEILRDQLYDVEALSPTDAWAVGIRLSGVYNRPLSLHWSGQRWKPVYMPARGSSSIGKLAASSSTDLWAVGNYSFDSALYPLAEHSKGCS